MKCPYCGMDNPDNTKFCSNCGAGINEAQQQSQQIPYQNYQQNNVPQKKKKVGCLTIGLIVVAVFVVFGVIGAALSGSDEGKTSTSSKEESSAVSGSQPEENKLKIGSTATISTSQGDYKVTITGVEKGTVNEFADSHPKRIVRINYEYENISADSVTVSYLYFRVYDANGNLLEYYPDPDAKQSGQITAGKKNTASCSYGLDSDTNYLELEVLPIDDMIKPACKFELKW